MLFSRFASLTNVTFLPVGSVSLIQVSLDSTHAWLHCFDCTFVRKYRLELVRARAIFLKILAMVSRGRRVKAANKNSFARIRRAVEARYICTAPFAHLNFLELVVC